MTDNLPAVRPTREVATQDTDSWTRVMGPLIELSNRIYDTEFVPKGLRGSAPATTAAMLYGREVGLPPMSSLNMIHVVEGRPALSAEGMRSLVAASGHELEYVESTGAVCTMRARRRGGDRWTELSWSIDMARAAGIAGGHNWKKYPRAMLSARCTTELCRMVFPDVIHGFRSVEELEDMSEDGATSGGPAASSGTAKVSRRRTAKKTAASAAVASIPDNSATPAPTPPLPGEPGYDDTETAGEGEDASAEETRASDVAGEDVAPSPAPEGSGVEQTAPDPAPETPPAEEQAKSKEEQATHPTGPRKPTRAQMRMLMGMLGGFGISGDDEREERMLVATTILGREVETFSDLSAAETKTLIDALALVTPATDRAALNRLLDQYEEGRKADKAAAEGDES